MSILSSRVMSSGLFTTLLAIGAVSSVVGCAKPEEEKKAAWTCVRDEVPMGEALRCTQQAATADGPVSAGATTTTTGGTTDGTTSTGTGTAAGTTPVSDGTTTSGSGTTT